MRKLLKHKNSPYLIAAAILLLLIIYTVTSGIHLEKILTQNSEPAGQRVLYSVSEQTIKSAPITAEISPTLIKSTPNKFAANIVEPKIVIIISNLGLSAALTKEAIDLPPEITLGLSPYGNNLTEITNSATKAGHDLLMNVPLQPISYPLDDAGPLALLLNLSESDNKARLEELSSLSNNIIGFYSTDRESFSHSWNSMKTMLDYVKDRGVAFVYGGGSDNYIVNQISEAIHYNIITSDLYLDSEMSGDSIVQKLNQLEELARQNGIAIGIAKNYPISVKLIKDWYNLMQSNPSIKIVGISELFKGKVNQDEPAS